MTVPPEPTGWDPQWGEARAPVQRQLTNRRLAVLDSYRPLKVHSEFHRLVLAWEEAVMNFCWLSTDKDGALAVEDGYVALQQRRKELYEWVRDNTAIPEPLYANHIKF